MATSLPVIRGKWKEERGKRGQKAEGRRQGAVCRPDIYLQVEKGKQDDRED
jgi:hypothetical protein